MTIILTAVVSVIGSLVSSITAISVCVLNNKSQNNKTEALLELRFNNLEKQVNKHNEVIERTFKLEAHTQLLDEQIKVINHRINDLEVQEERTNDSKQTVYLTKVN